MKLLNRLFMSGLTLAFVLSLGISTANADTTSKKKKKKAAATVVKKKKHVDVVYSGEINGGNVTGRPGYLYSDTAYTLEKGVFMGGAHATFYSYGSSSLGIPFGGSYGITKDLQVSASTVLNIGSGQTTLGNLILGGKYAFKTSVERLKIAAGLDIPIGPLTTYTNNPYSSVSFLPYGVGTYTFLDGFQLNGQLGIFVPGSYKGATPGAYVQFNAGAAYPFSKDLTGIAEFDINGITSANSPLIAGVRTGHDVQLQAYAGLDLASTVGVLIGGGVVLVSQ